MQFTEILQSVASMKPGLGKKPKWYCLKIAWQPAFKAEKNMWQTRVRKSLSQFALKPNMVI